MADNTVRCRLVLLLAGTLLFFGFSGCTISYHYTIAGKIVRSIDGAGIENALVKLKTKQGLIETHTDKSGEFQLVCSFSSSDYTMGYTQSELVIGLPNGREQTLDVTPKKRARKGY